MYEEAGSIVFQQYKVVPLPNLIRVIPCTHGITAVSFDTLFGTTAFYTTQLDTKGVLLFDGPPAVGDRGSWKANFP